MNTITMDNPASSLRPDLMREPAFAAPQSGQGFSSLLTAASDRATQAGKTAEGKLREAVEQLVSSAFVLPILNQVRESSMNSDLFGGGFAENSFRQQLDTVLADRIVGGGNFPLVDVIQDRLAQTYRAQAEGARTIARLDTAA